MNPTGTPSIFLAYARTLYIATKSRAVDGFFVVDSFRFDRLLVKKISGEHKHIYSNISKATE